MPVSRSERDNLSPVHARARRKARPLTLVGCLLGSLALNYGGLWASLLLFNSGSPLPPPMVRMKLCVDGQTRSERLLEAAISGENIDLLRGRLGFNGLITSDATQMGGLTSWSPRAVHLAEIIENGCDMVLFSDDLEGDIGLGGAAGAGSLGAAEVCRAARFAGCTAGA